VPERTFLLATNRVVKGTKGEDQAPFRSLLHTVRLRSGGGQATRLSGMSGRESRQCSPEPTAKPCLSCRATHSADTPCSVHDPVPGLRSPVILWSLTFEPRGRLGGLRLALVLCLSRISSVRLSLGPRWELRSSLGPWSRAAAQHTPRTETEGFDRSIGLCKGTGSVPCAWMQRTGE
jgi:hypothetical protein